MKINEIKDKIKSILATFMDEPTPPVPPMAMPTTLKLKDGTEVEATTLPDGEHELETGEIAVVLSGVVTEIKEAMAALPLPPAPIPAPAPAAFKVAQIEGLKELVNAAVSTAFSIMLKENEALKKQNAKFSTQLKSVTETLESFADVVIIVDKKTPTLTDAEYENLTAFQKRKLAKG